MNGQAVEVERALRRPVMGSFHGFWSAGLLASSGVTAGIAAAGVSVRTNLLVAAVLLALLALVAPRGLLRGRGTALTRVTRRGPLALTVIALGVIGFCSFLGEGAAADWSGVYLHEDAGSSAGLAAFAFSAFAVGMVLSRFCADRLSARFGPVLVVRVGGLIAGIGLILGLVLVEVPAVLVAFTLLGLGLAPIVPVVFSAAGNVGSGARALGWVVTMSYVGVVLGPAAIGAAAHGIGLTTRARDPRGARARRGGARWLHAHGRRAGAARAPTTDSVIATRRRPGTTSASSRPHPPAARTAARCRSPPPPAPRAPWPASGRARRTSPRAC